MRWQLIGLGALAVLTATVSALALLQNRTPVQEAVPATSSPAQTPSTEGPATSPSSSVSPSASALPSASPAPSISPLQAVAELIAEPDSSVLVLGDGSGNEDDEWVAVWARDHLGADRSVEYHLWNRTDAVYSSPVNFGSGRDLTLWNGSVRGPDLEVEPTRIGKAWQDADVVLLSYGHRQYPRYITDHMDAILKAIRQESSEVPVVVVLQNPAPASNAETHDLVVERIAEWAADQGLPTIDVYGGFPQDQDERDNLVESDGSPNPEGSELFAQIVADALTPAAG